MFRVDIRSAISGNDSEEALDRIEALLERVNVETEITLTDGTGKKFTRTLYPGVPLSDD